jgi:hypothetical protein
MEVVAKELKPLNLQSGRNTVRYPTRYWCMNRYLDEDMRSTYRKHEAWYVYATEDSRVGINN